MTTAYEGPRQPNADIDDIVKIDGYGNKLYRIDSVNYEFYRDSESEYDEIFYEATRVTTLEHVLAENEDITLISRSENADKYLRMNIAKPKPRAPLPTVDDLLLDLSDALALQERFGDHEDDEKEDRKYALKVCEIKAQLRERTEAGKWQYTS